MTHEEIGKLTVEELEAAASRVAAALEVLRSAGAYVPPTPMAVAPVEAPPPAPVARIQPAPSSVRFTPAEQAERKRLLQLNRPELPPDITAAEEG